MKKITPSQIKMGMNAVSEYLAGVLGAGSEILSGRELNKVLPLTEKANSIVKKAQDNAFDEEFKFIKKCGYPDGINISP